MWANVAGGLAAARLCCGVHVQAITLGAPVACCPVHARSSVRPFSPAVTPRPCTHTTALRLTQPLALVRSLPPSRAALSPVRCWSLNGQCIQSILPPLSSSLSDLTVCICYRNISAHMQPPSALPCCPCNPVRCCRSTTSPSTPCCHPFLPLCPFPLPPSPSPAAGAVPERPAHPRPGGAGGAGGRLRRALPALRPAVQHEGGAGKGETGCTCELAAWAGGWVNGLCAGGHQGAPAGQPAITMRARGVLGEGGGTRCSRWLILGACVGHQCVCWWALGPACTLRCSARVA